MSSLGDLVLDLTPAPRREDSASGSSHEPPLSTVLVLGVDQKLRPNGQRPERASWHDRQDAVPRGRHQLTGSRRRPVRPDDAEVEGTVDLAEVV